MFKRREKDEVQPGTFWEIKHAGGHGTVREVVSRTGDFVSFQNVVVEGSKVDPKVSHTYHVDTFLSEGFQKIDENQILMLMILERIEELETGFNEIYSIVQGGIENLSADIKERLEDVAHESSETNEMIETTYEKIEELGRQMAEAEDRWRRYIQE